jgi:predicted transcriptional regulator
MNVNEIIEKLELETLSSVDEKEVEGVFISDMLSDVMSSAKAGDLWITVQTHKNIVSASNLVDIAAIVITQGKKVPAETIDLANRFRVIILGTSMSTFELVGKLVEIGLKPQ